MADEFEDDMVEGYRDGLQADSPEPSANRSASYRHGFANGRADLEQRRAFGSIAEARSAAAIAIAQDKRA